MTEAEKQDKLYEALEKVIERYMVEFDMTYMSSIGAMELLKVNLACEAFCLDEDEDDDEGEEWKIVVDE